MKGMTIHFAPFPPLSELGSLRSGVDRAGKPKSSLVDYSWENLLKFDAVRVGFGWSGSRMTPEDSELLTGGRLWFGCCATS